MCFLYADAFLLRIYYENSVWDSLHVLDTAKVLLELLLLFLKLDNFFLRKNIKCSVLFHLLDVLKSLDSALDCLEVSEHTAKPSLINIVHSATLCLSLNCVLSLLLSTYEKDCSALLCNIIYCIVSFINLTY